MKEFMVFNTNSDILPHIIEQALRQRALLAPSWALIAIPTFCCLWQQWRCKLLIPKDSDCEVNLPFHFVLNRHWVEVPFLKPQNCEAEVLLSQYCENVKLKSENTCAIKCYCHLSSDCHLKFLALSFRSTLLHIGTSQYTILQHLLPDYLYAPSII